MLAELDRRARRRRQRRAGIIRDALSAYLALPEGDARPATIDRIRHLLGAIDGLPRSLAGCAGGEPEASAAGDD
jgi:hypothetical protein